MARPVYNRFIAPIKKTNNTNNRNNLSVLILGALPSYRMRSYGAKSLIKLNSGETIIQNQVDNIRIAYPDCDIVLTTGFCADKVIKYRPQSVRIIENQLFNDTNVFEELRLGLNNILTDNVLIIHGEIIFNTDIIVKLTKTGFSTILVDNNGIIDNDDIGVTIVNERATIFSYDIFPKWAYIAYLTGKELKLFKSICNDREKNKLYMFEGLNYVLERGGVMKPIEVPNGQLYKIDSAKNII
jgi:hypothetical protein